MVLQYNIHALIPETEQAREDRKRRKEAKKAEKARLAALSTGIPDASSITDQGVQPVMQAPTPMTNGAPTPAANSSFPSASIAASVTKNDRMTNHPPQNAQLRLNGRAVGASTPTSQRPGTSIDQQAGTQSSQRPNMPSLQSTPQQQTPRLQPTSTQSRPPVHAQTQPQSQAHTAEVNFRGMKRERPDTPLSQHHPPSHPHSSPQVFSNHHGMVGHPSAAKKRRLESATAVR
jgi:hypothetical protein